MFFSGALHERSNLAERQHERPPFSLQRPAHAAVPELRVARLPFGRPPVRPPLLRRRGSASAVFPPVSCKRQWDPPHPPRGQAPLSLLDSNILQLHVVLSLCPLQALVVSNALVR